MIRFGSSGTWHCTAQRNFRHCSTDRMSGVWSLAHEGLALLRQADKGCASIHMRQRETDERGDRKDRSRVALIGAAAIGVVVVSSVLAWYRRLPANDLVARIADATGGSPRGASTAYRWVLVRAVSRGRE